MFEGDAELLSDFVTESREGLAEIETDLLAIEAAGAEIDLDLVNKVFRAIHSIKGASGFMGLSVIGELSHSMEHVLSEVRNQVLVPTSPILDQLLKSADQLKQLIDNVEASNSVDVSSFVNELKRINQDYTGPGSVQTEAQSDPVSDADNSIAEQFEVAKDRIQKCLADGQHLLEISFDLLTDREAEHLCSLLQRLRDIGTILDSYLEISTYAGGAGEPLTWHVLYATVLRSETFATFFSLPATRIIDVTSVYAENESQQSEAHHQEVTAESASLPSHPAAETTPPVEQTRVNATPQVHATQQPVITQSSKSSEKTSHREQPAAPEFQGSKKPVVAESNIRVSVGVLDRLMNLAGELVLGRNQLLQISTGDDRRALEAACSRIDQVTCELQDAIMQTRMQPVGTVFSKFTRIIRDLGQQLGKQCELVIEGKDVELDRTIIEAISDPLTHLVRNSMDHGVERPEVREEKGKSATGTITLAARHQEGKVLLTISDDGAGIDAQRIRRKATEKGLLTAEAAEALSDRDAVQLIFAPGFSTAEQVTAVSGRGVGMDVVKTNIERLGGSVEIETSLGHGTTMLVRLPLTLAIIPSLIASHRGQRLAIPQVSISELVRVRPIEYAERISRVNRSEVLRLRGNLLPLVRLGDIFSDDATDDNDEKAVTNIVVVESGRLRYGLVVDSLHESEEIVVKPLGRHLKHLSFLSGATILGDGCVAMILDAGGLANRANLQSHHHAATERQTASSLTHKHDERIPTLLFSNHPEEWFGVPMAVVARIERIQVDQIDTVASRQVLQYRGGTLTLLSLEDCIDARPREYSDRVYVIVFRHGGLEIGLVAPQIVDIREQSTAMDTVSFQEAGVLGSAVVDGHTVRFLDVFDLGNTEHSAGRQVERHATAVQSTESQAEDAAPVILYAEDSAFFRNKVAKFMEEQGWTVVPCEDGQDAWEQLCDGRVQPHLVLTDIEMPRMSGFELCQEIRRSKQWADLPVLGITSLAGDADRAHGVQCGITEYLVKLDRDLLLSTLSRYLRSACLSG